MIPSRVPALMLAAALLTLSLLTVGGSAHAQPDSNSAGEAAEHFKQGKEHYRAGRYVESHDAYQRAWALQKGYDIAGNLGNVEVRLGRYRQAVEHLQFVLDHLPPSVSGDERERVLKMTRGLLDKAKSHVAVIRLAVTPEGAEITLDGEAVGIAPLREPFIFEPGEHVLTISLAGYQTVEQPLIARAGQDETLRISLVEGSGTAPQPDDNRGPSVPVIVAGSAVALVAMGVGGALLGVSAGKGNDATALRQDIGANLPPGNCMADARAADSVLDARCAELDDAVDAEGVFFGSGLGLLIGGGVLGVVTLSYALWPRDDGNDGDESAMAAPDVMLVPVAAPGFAGMAVSGRF